MRFVRVIALAAVLGPAHAQAASPAASSHRLMDHRYSEPAEVVRAYWTPERMAHIPYEQDGPIKPPVADPLESDGDAWEGNGPYPAGVGRLLLHRPELDLDTSCTATVVHAGRPDILVTAGHCIQSTPGTAHTLLMFVPAFRDGQAPLGTYPVRRVTAPLNSAGELTPDVAFLQVETNEAGRDVASVAGSQRITFNAAAHLGPVITFGYPLTSSGFGLLPADGPQYFGNPEYTGQRLAYCSTQRPTLSKCGFGENPPDWGLACVQSSGSSGGPRLTGFNYDTGLGTVSAVHSHGNQIGGRAANCAAALDEAARQAFERIQQR